MSALLDAAAFWAPLSVVTLAAYVFTPGTAISDSDIPRTSALGAVSAEIYIILVVLATWALITRAAHLAPVNVGTKKTAQYILFVAGALVLVTLLVSSWLLFGATGGFLNLSLLRLGGGSFVEILQHAAHLAPLGFLLAPALVGGVVAISIALLARVRRIPYATAGRLAVATALLGGAFGIVDFLGLASTASSRYRAHLAQRAGPTLHLQFDLMYRLTVDQDQFARAASVVPPTVPREQGKSTLVKSPSEAAWRPNVLVIVVESLRNDQLTAFGGARSVMPAVDRFAKDARRFTNHRTQASHSDYADIAILSSHYPLRDRVYHIYPEDAAYPRLRVYDLLQEHGYRVGIFSSQNEAWGGMINYLASPSIDRFLHADSYDGPTYVPREDPGFARFVKGSKRSGKIDDRFTVAEAVKWIEETPDEPFFIYMNLQNSHFPYERPADFPPRFGPGTVSFPIAFNNFPPDSAAAVLDLYSNSLAYVDAQIDQLFAALAASGEWENTVVVLTGDTGQAFYEHDAAAHGGPLWDEVMKVPLIIRIPGEEGASDDRLSQHIDIPPTILSLLEIEIHPGYQGRSLTDPSWGWTRPVFLVSQALQHQYAVVWNGFKLIFDARGSYYLLYDLQSDPGETADLSQVRPELVASMALSLHSWRRSHLAYYEDDVLQSTWYPPMDVVYGVPDELRGRE